MRSKKSETQWTLLFCRFVKTSGLDSWTLIFGRFVEISGLDSVLLWVNTRLEVPNSSFCSIAEKSNKCLPNLFACHNLVNVAHKTKWVRNVENIHLCIFLVKSQKQLYIRFLFQIKNAHLLQCSDLSIPILDWDTCYPKEILNFQ